MADEPKIIEEGAEQRPATEFTGAERLNFSHVGTRDEIEAYIKGCVAMPLEFQEWLLKVNSKTDANSNHWRLTANCSPHNGGSNGGWTISRIR